VDVGLSGSRVGGKTQLPAYRAVVSDLRLAYNQFEELEAFARFGTRLDDDTRRTLARGERVREGLQQSQYATISAAAPVGTLPALTNGLFDGLPLAEVPTAEEVVRNAMLNELPDLWSRIESGEPLDEADRERVLALARGRIEEAFEVEFDADS